MKNILSTVILSLILGYFSTSPVVAQEDEDYSLICVDEINGILKATGSIMHDAVAAYSSCMDREIQAIQDLSYSQGYDDGYTQAMIDQNNDQDIFILDSVDFSRTQLFIGPEGSSDEGRVVLVVFPEGFIDQVQESTTLSEFSSNILIYNENENILFNEQGFNFTTQFELGYSSQITVMFNGSVVASTPHSFQITLDEDEWEYSWSGEVVLINEEDPWQELIDHLSSKD